MEYKSSILKIDAKYSGDSTLLLEEIDLKFGLKKNNSGLSQLIRKIQSLYPADTNKRLKIRNLHFGQKKVIYPVLIVNEVYLNFGLAGWIFRRWFKQALDLDTVDSGVTIKDLLLLTIEDLEGFAPYLESGDFTIEEFAKFYSDSLNTEWFEPMTSIEDVLKKFREENNFEFRNNERISSKSDAVIHRIMSDFKD